MENTERDIPRNRSTCDWWRNDTADNSSEKNLLGWHISNVRCIRKKIEAEVARTGKDSCPVWGSGEHRVHDSAGMADSTGCLPSSHSPHLLFSQSPSSVQLAVNPVPEGSEVLQTKSPASNLVVLPLWSKIPVFALCENSEIDSTFVAMPNVILHSLPSALRSSKREILKLYAQRLFEYLSPHKSWHSPIIGKIK